MAMRLTSVVVLLAFVVLLGHCSWRARSHHGSLHGSTTHIRR